MRYTISDIAYDTAKSALEKNGFVLDETRNRDNYPISADVWTTSKDGEAYGFICGRITESGFGIGSFFQLAIDDFYLRDDLDNPKERFAAVVLDIIKRTSIR
jgi:hypothetical protein